MIQIPKQVKQVLKTLNDNGYEGYIVGGAVRDYLMGNEPHDWDITTNATPEQTKACFAKTIDTGIKHGTVTAMLDGEGYEITTYRVDGNYSDGRHPDEVTFVGELREDLARRDFTINAIAMDIDGNIVDPFGGVDDIKSGTIRCVGNPDDRFSEDALRILRAVRFEAKFDFNLDPSVASAISRHTPNLKKIASERIRDELTKMLLSKNPTKGFEDAYKTGITKVVLPEFDAMMECGQNSPYHYTDVAHHSLDVVKGVRPDANLRWAALLHDVGKPSTKTWSEEKQRDRFIDHPEKSAEMTVDILKRLRFSNADVNYVTKLVKYHDMYLEKPSALRLFAATHGRDYIDDLMELKNADAMAHTKEVLPELLANNQALSDKIYSYFDDGSAITKKELKINGNELMSIGFRDKAIKEFIDIAYKDCLGEPSHNNNEYLTNRATRYFEKKQREEENRLRSLPATERGFESSIKTPDP